MPLPTQDSREVWAISVDNTVIPDGGAQRPAKQESHLRGRMLAAYAVLCLRIPDRVFAIAISSVQRKCHLLQRAHMALFA